jgi:hypothetical protein
MNKKTLSKIFSTSLSLAMAVTSAPIPAGAIGPMEATAPAFASRFAPAEKFGYVSSSFSPNKDAKAPRLIVLSDLHAHVEVQHNLIGIMRDLVNKLNPAPGKQVPIFVEGGVDKHLEEPLRTVPDAKTRSFLSEYLLQKSRIGSAQAFSEEIAGSGKVRLIGVEDPTAYRFNRKQYLKTYPERKQLLMALAREEKALRQLSKYVVNGSFEKVQSMRDDYNAGRLGADRYARALLRYADRFHLTGPAVDVLRNVQQAPAGDLDNAFANVYRVVAEKLSAKAPWTAFLRRSLGNEQTMRENIARFDADFDLLKRLVANQLTPGEVRQALIRLPSLKAMAMSLAGPELGNGVSKVVEESLDFYPYALIRDGILVKNSLHELDAAGDPEATGILVVGGFHTDAILEYLRNNGISYLHINPSITRDLTSAEQINYVKRMGDEPVTPEELSNDLATLSKGGKSVSNSSAAGVVSNTADPALPAGGLPEVNPNVKPPTTGGSSSQVGGGYLGERLKGLNAEKLSDALKNFGLSHVDDAVPEGAIYGRQQMLNVAELNPVGSEQRERLRNLADKIKVANQEDGNESLSWIVLLPDDFTVRLEGAKYVSDVPLNRVQRSILARINSNPIGKDAPKKIDVFIATDRSAKAMAGEALTLHNKNEQEERAAVIFTKSRAEEGVASGNWLVASFRWLMNKIGYKSIDYVAVSQAIHAQTHEAYHAVNQEHRESVAEVLGGLFAGSKVAAATFTELGPQGAVLAFLDANVPQVGLYNQANDPLQEFANLFSDKRFRVALADQIAILVVGPDAVIDDTLAQAVMNATAAAHPDWTPFQVSQMFNASKSGMASRAAQFTAEERADPRFAEALAKLFAGRTFESLTPQEAEAVRIAA